MPHQIGDQVGDYQVVGVLGSGGTGELYKVRNVISGRLEAMKVLALDLEPDSASADRILREIKALAALEHPNLAALRTAFRAGNQLVMVMELVEGESLADRLRQGPIPIPEALNYFRQALAALEYAHARGVTHCDVKPANIMLTPEGRVKLMDLGVAKAVGRGRPTGGALGSPGYLSPEQLSGGTPDARSDIYALGVVLYEALTGAPPFQGDGDLNVMAAQLEGRVTPPIQLNPSLDPALSELIMMAIAKDPAQRFQSAQAFRRALEQVGARLGAITVSEATTPASNEAPFAPARPEKAVDAAASPGPKSHRGLYMALGATLGIALLVLAATQLPRWLRTSATGAQTAVSVAQPQSSAAERTSVPSAPAAAGEEPATAPEGPAVQPSPMSRMAPPEPAGAHRMAVQAQTGQTSSFEAPAAQPSAATAQPAIQQIQDRMVKLASRAGAIRGSLDNLQRQQAAMGLGLRADISASWKRMEYYLDQVEAALSKGDAESARRHLEAAEREIDQLETFLGR